MNTSDRVIIILGMFFFIVFSILLIIDNCSKTCSLCEQAKAKANEIITNEKSEHFEYHCSKCGTDIKIDFGKEM